MSCDEFTFTEIKSSFTATEESDYFGMTEGRTITVDDELSPTSTNPVQNKVVTEAINELEATKQDVLTFDDSPTADSDNPITSGGIFNALLDKAPVIVDSASGSIASFSDGIAAPFKVMSFTVEPVQDLHGQSSPYPAGGGKNKFKDTFDGWTKPVNYWIYPVSLAEGNWIVSATLRTGKTKVTGCAIGFATSGTEYTSFQNLRLCVGISGDAVSPVYAPVASTDSPCLVFYGTAESFAQIMDAYEIQLEAGMVSTPYAPYSNICPISGWTSANLVGAGKNLLKLTEYTPSGYHRSAGFDMKAMEAGATVTESGNVVTIVNTATAVRGGLFSTDILPSGEYYVYIGTTLDYTNRRASVYICNENYIVTSWVRSYADIAPTVSCLVTLTESARICVFYGASTVDTVNAVDAQAVVGSTATSYEAPTIRNLALDFGQTLYGATVKWNGDDMWTVTSEWVDYAVTGDETYNRFANNKATILASRLPKAPKTTGRIISNVFASAFSSANPPIGSVCIYSSNGNIVFGIDTSEITNITEWTAYATANNLHICYELATPTTFTITTDELFASLKGVNNVFVNCGDVSCDYRADTKGYIDRKILEAITNALNA